MEGIELKNRLHKLENKFKNCQENRQELTIKHTDMQVLLYAINAALVEPQLRFERDTLEKQLSELGYSLGEKIWHNAIEDNNDLPDINSETEESDLIEFITTYYLNQEHYIGVYSKEHEAFLDRDGDELNPEDCVWRYVKDYDFK